MKPLTLHLKREFWEAIRDGTKTEEFRLRLPYWTRRIDGQAFSGIVLLCGYPKRGDDSRTLRRTWKGCTKKMIRHAHFGQGLVSVYAIDVSEPLEVQP